VWQSPSGSSTHSVAKNDQQKRRSVRSTWCYLVVIVIKKVEHWLVSGSKVCTASRALQVFWMRTLWYDRPAFLVTSYGTKVGRARLRTWGTYISLPTFVDHSQSSVCHVLFVYWFSCQCYQVHRFYKHVPGIY